MKSRSVRSFYRQEIVCLNQEGGEQLARAVASGCHPSLQIINLSWELHAVGLSSVSIAVEHGGSNDKLIQAR